MPSMVSAVLTVNGVRHELSAHPDTTLLWILRDQLKLTGAKYGCGKGECGACTVHLDGKPAYACQYVLADVGARAVTTIEGLASELAQPLEWAWAEAGLPPCDFCRSGQIMRAAGLLRAHPAPTRDAFTAHMQSNTCRCGMTDRIHAALAQAAPDS
jgi:isoquinoline 1-oxidoreductase subunit alpha